MASTILLASPNNNTEFPKRILLRCDTYTSPGYFPIGRAIEALLDEKKNFLYSSLSPPRAYRTRTYRALPLREVNRSIQFSSPPTHPAAVNPTKIMIWSKEYYLSILL